MDRIWQATSLDRGSRRPQRLSHFERHEGTWQGTAKAGCEEDEGVKVVRTTANLLALVIGNRQLFDQRIANSEVRARGLPLPSAEPRDCSALPMPLPRERSQGARRGRTRQVADERLT